MGEPSQQEIETLRQRARDWVREGRLPQAPGARTWGGTGSGSACALCGREVTSSDTEIEVELELAGSAASVHFHRSCHHLWEQARIEAARRPWRPMSAGTPPLDVPIEARLGLGAARSLILTVVQKRDPATGQTAWINATTRGPLPDHWVPTEWRPLATEGGALSAPVSAESSPGTESASSSLPRRA